MSDHQCTSPIAEVPEKIIPLNLNRAKGIGGRTLPQNFGSGARLDPNRRTRVGFFKS